MMKEYILTLRERALKGDTEAAEELDRVLSYRDSVQRSTQRMASNLRSQGVDVGYRKDGGIEFELQGGQEKVKVFKRKSTHSEKSAKPQRDYLSDESKIKSSPLTWVKLPVYFCSGIVGLFLLYRSLGLFQIAFSKFGLGSISNVCPTLGYIPFLGEGLKSGCDGLAGLVIGVISLTVLITVTVLQVLPTLLYFHPKSISDMVYQLRANLRTREFLQHETTDNAEISQLVKRHNTLSDRSLKTLLVFSVLAFCVEAWIVWVARSGRADVGSVLVDSLAFDALVAATLAFRNAFHAKPVKPRQYGH